MNRIFAQLGVAIVALALISCASFPVQEISDARQAIDAADAANASQLAPMEYQEARVLLKDADRLIGEGRYGLAEKVAKKAKSTAMKARRKALESSQSNSVN